MSSADDPTFPAAMTSLVVRALKVRDGESRTASSCESISQCSS